MRKMITSRMHKDMGTEVHLNFFVLQNDQEKNIPSLGSLGCVKNYPRDPRSMQ